MNSPALSSFRTVDYLRIIARNLASDESLLYYRHKQKKLEACDRFIFSLRNFTIEVPKMITNCAVNEGFEISPRFRQMVEERIARLERDAEHDEAQVSNLADTDHIRRQMRLVAIERSEALRMRLFLYHSKTRESRPMIAL